MLPSLHNLKNDDVAMKRQRTGDARHNGTVKRLGDHWCVEDDETGSMYFFFNQIFRNHFRGLGSQEEWMVVSAIDGSLHWFIFEVDQNSSSVDDDTDTFHFAPEDRVTFVPKRRDELKASKSNNVNELLLKIHSAMRVEESSFEVPERFAGVACDIKTDR